ncbi:MAG TPA: Rrf2 family transcriptional regulator, partial [Aeromicrobium sp.]|nr:Rrf2 family transcriptional regulator [Aeromicrobium sp.]
VADVIRAVDGPLVSVYGVRPESVVYTGRAEVLGPVWVAARSALREVLEDVTIDQLASGQLPASVVDRTADDDAWRSH